MKKIEKYLIIAIGWWQYLWGFCPKCNSDAPELYSCSVCQYNKIPKKLWWNRFINEL